MDWQIVVSNFNASTDYLKHLTTLSTGLIVIIAAFWDKVQKKALVKSNIDISLYGFMVSVLSAVICHTLLILFEKPGSTSPSPQWVHTLGGLSLLCTGGGFFVGIMALALFAKKELCAEKKM